MRHMTSTARAKAHKPLCATVNRAHLIEKPYDHNSVPTTHGNIEQLWATLLAYCERDTEAMVVLAARLAELCA